MKMNDRLVAILGFERRLRRSVFIIGPLFLILDGRASPQSAAAFNYDLLFRRYFGLFLTAKWKVRGCVAALLLLAFSGRRNTCFFPANQHLASRSRGIDRDRSLISSLVFERSFPNGLYSKESELERNERRSFFLEEILSQNRKNRRLKMRAAARKAGGLAHKSRRI